MIAARFIENETQEPVTVDCVFTWGSEERCCVVTYSSGKRYALPEPVFSRHFSIVSPQEIFITAIGGIHDRPTKEQAKAEEVI
jgi:hypothetical protein